MFSGWLLALADIGTVTVCLLLQPSSLGIWIGLFLLIISVIGYFVQYITVCCKRCKGKHCSPIAGIAFFFWTIVMIASLGGTGAIIYLQNDPNTTALINFPLNNVTLICPNTSVAVPPSCAAGLYFNITDTFVSDRSPDKDCKNFSHCLQVNPDWNETCPDSVKWMQTEVWVQPSVYIATAAVLYSVWFISSTIIFFRSIFCWKRGTDGVEAEPMTAL